MASDRGGGLLTDRQRQYLRGELADEIEPKTQDERDIRRRIRRQLGNALMDYQILNDYLETRDLRQVADGLDDELVPSVRAAVAFLYRCVESSEQPLDAEAVIEQGIREGRSGQLETLRQRLEEDDETLTLGEIRTLAEAGDLDREQRRELQSEILRPPIGNVGPDDAREDESLEEYLDRKVEERREE